MLAMHVFDVPEIDAQHEVIFAQVRWLQEALSDPGRQHPIQPALAQLHELLVSHFAAEESYMDEHRRQHAAILDLLEQCLASPSAAGNGGPDEAKPVGELIDALKSHELQNPDIAW